MQCGLLNRYIKKHIYIYIKYYIYMLKRKFWNTFTRMQWSYMEAMYGALYRIPYNIIHHTLYIYIYIYFYNAAYLKFTWTCICFICHWNSQIKAPTSFRCFFGIRSVLEQYSFCCDWRAVLYRL